MRACICKPLFPARLSYVRLYYWLSVALQLSVPGFSCTQSHIMHIILVRCRPEVLPPERLLLVSSSAQLQLVMTLFLSKPLPRDTVVSSSEAYR